MSRINSYANVLREFVYDPEVQLINQSPGEIPCFYCVCNIHRDLSLRCCAGPSPECCVFCADDRKKCGSYFGAVQAYYLAIERLQDRFADEELDPTQHSGCYNSVPRHCVPSGPSGTPVPYFRGVELTPEEVSARVASAMPLYARNVSAATRLRSAILRLDTCEDVPVEGEGTCDELPSAFEAKPALRALLDEHSDNPVPDVPVAFAGVAPVSRPGQSTPARRRGAAEPPRTPE
ncbi:uncharacterized protein FFUJ_08063 [Fusarium fujikuroi IMI 58289]|uniref:Uncharacterized protein n=1 Tax=Gibberella fujikuroi (strain CBS 195.34 / IMI 58289 / NRRL A-6831) TaxID=1279085 RepID=S0E2Q9_GIBF5|nr:uncharacterized protein FFUJ_08063 [Fusarium fujikuroi IMI 58289]CCT69124.1 uncharacterized protein FFUJ_08063 [Fusarium fujikuroi IMI 58289]